MRRSLLAISIFLLVRSSVAPAQETSKSASLSPLSAVQVARRHVQLYAILPDADELTQKALDPIDVGRDPETSATSFVHAIRRNAKKLLSAEQAERLESTVARWTPQLKRLHDERNVLRGYFFARAWTVPGLANEEERLAERRRMNEWLDVWMEVRLQEQIAHHHYCREAWAILTAAQRDGLVAGEWDKYAKKSTGHKRNYFDDRIVSRALGPPSRSDAFDAVSADCEREHAAIRKTLLSAEVSYRKAAFTIPSLPDQALLSYWAKVDRAYRSYFLSQARHIELLVDAGYELDDATTRSRLLTVPDEEFKKLDEKIAAKLTSGKTLRELIEGCSGSTQPLALPTAKDRHVLIAAHRGGYANDKADAAPENTLANLRLAIEKGFDVYETDIQRTSDGVFVIMHDATIDRETDASGVVSEMTWEQLKSVRKRYRDGSASSEGIATLEELLLVGRHGILFKPDLKPGVVEHFDELARLIARLGMSDQVFIRTDYKNAKVIGDCFANRCPRVEVMFKTKSVAQVNEIVNRFSPKTIQIDIAKNESLSKSKIAAIRAAVDAGVLVETHIYKDPEQWQPLAERGVRMFHTSIPDQVLDVLKSIGWRSGRGLPRSTE